MKAIEMELRDYFAALAMQSLVGQRGQVDESDADRVAASAYLLADRMLLARDKAAPARAVELRPGDRAGGGGGVRPRG